MDHQSIVSTCRVGQDTLPIDSWTAEMFGAVNKLEMTHLGWFLRFLLTLSLSWVMKSTKSQTEKSSL